METKVITVTISRPARRDDRVYCVRSLHDSRRNVKWRRLAVLAYRLAAIFSVIVAIALVDGIVSGTTPIAIGIFSIAFFIVMAIINEQFALARNSHD